MAAMAEYAQYSFNLHQNLARTIIQERMHMAAYEEHDTTISCELGQLKHENDLLRGATLPPSDHNHKLKVTYHCLSEAEHGWNYTQQQLDAAHELVDEHTHMIIHLEHANKQQDLELEERAVVITSLEQQIQVSQLQATPAPVAPAEPDAMSNVDEE
jgi:hypothetical protein